MHTMQIILNINILMYISNRYIHELCCKCAMMIKLAKLLRFRITNNDRNLHLFLFLNTCKIEHLCNMQSTGQC